MTSALKKRTIYILLTITSVLLVLLFIGKLNSKKNSEVRPITTSMLNPKYADSIASIAIKTPQSQKEITLTKTDSVWTGIAKNDDDLQGVVWPVQLQTVNNLISISTKVAKMYIKSDSNSSWNTLSVTQDKASTIIFTGEDGQILSELYFGVINPITERISMRSAAKQTVYETDDVISVYLTTDVSFWADPYIYPQAVTGMSDNDSKSLLRHGQVVAKPADNAFPCIKSILKEFDNSAAVSLSIYSTQNSTHNSTEFLVIPTFIASPTVTAHEKSAIAAYNYAYIISGWTEKKLVSEEK